MVLGLNRSLAEKVSSSEFPSSLFWKKKKSCRPQHVHTCLGMLHQRHDCCSVAAFEHHGQPNFDSLCSVGPTLSLAENVRSSEFPSSLENSWHPQHGHCLVLEVKKTGMEAWSLNLMKNGTQLRRIWCKNPLRAGHPKFRWSNVWEKRKVSLHYNAETNPAEMLMKTIVSVSQLSMYRTVLTRYLERRCEGDNASPNTNLNISQEPVTKLTRHETSDYFNVASRDRSRSVNKNGSVEFKSQGQVSREAGFSKPVKVGHHFVIWPQILLEEHGITTSCREYSAMRGDPATEAKGVFTDNRIFGSIHDAKFITLHRGRYGIEVQVDL